MAVSLKDVLDEWKVDSVINDSNVQKELFKTPMMHSKYLDYYVYFKARLASMDKKYNQMAYVRKRYYRGELTKQELDSYGWDQYQGLKASSSEFNQLMDIDPVLVDMKQDLDACKTSVATLEYIMKNIQSRDYTLKTIVDYQKWISG